MLVKILLIMILCLNDFLLLFMFWELSKWCFLLLVVVELELVVDVRLMVDLIDGLCEMVIVVRGEEVDFVEGLLGEFDEE